MISKHETGKNARGSRYDIPDSLCSQKTYMISLCIPDTLRPPFHRPDNKGRKT